MTSYPDPHPGIDPEGDCNACGWSTDFIWDASAGRYRCMQCTAFGVPQAVLDAREEAKRQKSAARAAKPRAPRRRPRRRKPTLSIGRVIAGVIIVLVAMGCIGSCLTSSGHSRLGPRPQSRP